jgi:hypothetical protein
MKYLFISILYSSTSSGTEVFVMVKLQGISCKTAKKKKGMEVGFVNFENIEQVKRATEVPLYIEF